MTFYKAIALGFKGKRLCRSSWGEKSYICKGGIHDNTFYYFSSSKRIVYVHLLTLDDWIADDWEIYKGADKQVIGIYTTLFRNALPSTSIDYNKILTQLME